MKYCLSEMKEQLVTAVQIEEDDWDEKGRGGWSGRITQPTNLLLSKSLQVRGI